MSIFSRAENFVLLPDVRPVGVRLAEVQRAIHVQKGEVSDARRLILSPGASVDEYDSAVSDLDFAHGTLDVLRDTCRELQHKLGQNRKGQPLPEVIATSTPWE